MYAFSSTDFLTYDTELSRHAADRHAVLAAVAELRSAKRSARRRPRMLPARPHSLAIDVSPASPR